MPLHHPAFAEGRVYGLAGKNIMNPARDLYLLKKEKTIIIGIGTPDADQEALLQDQYVQSYVSIDFEEMGRLSYRYLKRLSEGGNIPKKTYTNSIVLRAKSE